MSADWPLVELSELVDELTVGFVGSMTHEYISDGIPFFRSKNIRPYDLNWDDVKYVSHRFHKKLQKSALTAGDVVIVRTGKPGTACVIPDSIHEANCSDVVIARVNDKKLSAHYLCYFMNSLATHQVNSRLVGAVQQHFNVGSAKKITIPLPARKEQEKIIRIVKILDDKLKLNYKMNKTLEEITQTLFKSWFVDFDPVHAKANASSEAELEQIAKELGISKEVLDLFPDEFEESELGMIPKGWEVSTIEDEVSIYGGATPSTKEPKYWDNGTNHWTTPRDLSGLNSKILIDTDRKITDKGVNKIGSKQLPIGTILLSSRAPVGYIAYSTVPISINQGYIAMVCNQKLSNYYIMYWLDVAMDEIKNRAGGTTFSEISKKSFRPIKLVVPEHNILSRYNTSVKSIVNSIIQNEKQIQTLQKNRDILLPKLLSGELDVSELNLEMQ